MRHTPIFRTFRRCPRCGGILRWQSETRGEPKRQTCRRCGYRVYHNPVTATEAYIVRDNRVLLLRRAREPRAGFWDVPGGFLETGEEPVRGLRREVAEELHARLVRPQLFGAYATGYRFQDELTAVIVLAYAGELRGRVRLNHENTEAEWITMSRASRLAFFHQQHALRDLRRWLNRTSS
jgi:ADP-ribose pyrophosphatase YjhB (NUDIX family)